MENIYVYFYTLFFVYDLICVCVYIHTVHHLYHVHFCFYFGYSVYTCARACFCARDFGAI